MEMVFCQKCGMLLQAPEYLGTKKAALPITRIVALLQRRSIHSRLYNGYQFTSREGVVL